MSESEKLIEKQEDSIVIECPNCFNENKILLSKEIKCKKCEKSLIDEKFRKPIFSALTIILFGSGIGMITDSYLNINRPSVKTEYKMMKWCIDNYGQYKSVRDTCACAVESMAGIVDAQKARLYGNEWLIDVLDKKYKSCRN
ncbi:MAG: hypothetical protein WC149_08275 [Arcobacteraceae bacterium]